MSQYILLSTDDPGVGGVAQYNNSILYGLIKSSYRVTSLQPLASNDKLITHQKDLGIEHLWMDKNTLNNLPHIFSIPGNKPDLIICSNSNPFSNLAVKQIALRLGIPYIIVEHLVEPYLAERFAAYLDELSYQYIEAKAVIAVSSENLRLLHQIFNLPKDKGQVIYNGRPYEFFTEHNSHVRERLRQALNIPSDAVVCFTSARIESRKGYQYQLEAIRQLMFSPVWSKLYFVWAGAGIFEPQLETELQKAIEQLEISQKVIFLGQRSDILDLLNAADIFVFPSMLEGMPLCVMEAMAKGLPVIASAVSGIPEELGETGKLLPDPKLNPQATVKELVETIEEWVNNPQLRLSIGEDCKQRAENMFREERMIKQTMVVIEHALLPNGDYVSPGFEIIQPDQSFPNMIVGDTNISSWPYLRREVPHNWYIDQRQQGIGFLSRDEAHILYNTALKFKGKTALEVGCWLGWSACHMALAGVELDVIDPLLATENIYESVSNSLKTAGVLNSVNLVAGYSPQKVGELAKQLQRKWSLIFIDGNHEAPGPLNDAIVCEQLAEADALILFHDLNSPDVAQGLDYLKQKGWNTMVYQTMQIMGVAWRGNIEPVQHQPDPKVNWNLPKHLQNYHVSGLSNQVVDFQQVQAMLQEAIALFNGGKIVEALRMAEKSARQGIYVPGMHYIRCICLCNVGRNEEGFEAIKAELELNPTNHQAQEQYKVLASVLSKPVTTKIPTHQRPWHTTLPRETMLSIQHAGHNYSYRGVPMIKNPFDFALYPLLFWKLKPRTIIEIGSKDGGSALWFGDMLNNFSIDGHIYSIDIVKVTSVKHSRVTYMEGNGRVLSDILTPDFINSLPRPLLVIEDADHVYETSRHVLEFFHPYIKTGEYIVIEDGIISDLTQDSGYNSGPHMALKEFLSAHPDEYEIDGNFCDFFGYNLTWCTNGFLKKIANAPLKNNTITKQEQLSPIIIIDGVFFQLYQSGIARVWTSLLEEWAKNGFSKHIIVLDRAGTAPKVPGIKYRTVPTYDYSNLDADRAILQKVCDEEDADVFISSYYTTPITTPSVFMAHDMIPEVLGWDISNPMWQAKHYGIKHASAYIAVSENTACDLAKCFTHIPIESITRAYCGVKSSLSPANTSTINAFKNKYGITKPYFLLVGTSGRNKNIILFFQAFAQLANSYGFEIILTGSSSILTPEVRTYTSDSTVHTLQLSDEELAIAYSGAIALVYPSIYEGFGMPLIEAMACGCPVITCPNSSIPEVAGEAAIYINHNDVNGLANALCEVQKPNVRQSLISAGLAQAKKFSWSVMANTVSATLIDASILYLNLNEINLIIFPDWSQSEELISLDLQEVIKKLAASSNEQKITLIIDTSDTNSEDAAILLSSVTMNLLMQEDIDINEGLEISLLGSLSSIQWIALLSKLTARIILEYENKQAITNWKQIIESETKSNILIEEVKIDNFITTYQLINNLNNLLEKYHNNKTSQSDLEELGSLRRQMAEILLITEKNQIEKLYVTKYGEAYKAILNTGIKYESLTKSEQSFVTEVLAKVAKGFDESNAIQYLLVAMLYCRPHQLPPVYDLTQIPNWLLYDYLEFNLKSPLYFQERGEVDSYYKYMEDWINYLHTNIINNTHVELWRNVAECFTQIANFIPLYFNQENVKDIYTKRADIIESYLRQTINNIEYSFSERSPERTKIKVGILASHFLPQTETFAALSVYEHLNRDLFEVVFFTFIMTNHRLERYCVGHADTVIKLSADLIAQVQAIREVDLDILFIATNITAVTHQITLLSLHRLARIQIVDANSPVTTGMRHIDYYISSKLSEIEGNAQQHYTEKLITLDSPPQCFNFATEKQILATKNICRQSLGINDNIIVYASGANYYKIIPEQEVTWAKIIASVPNSLLLLYPFNPNWSSSYPCIAFRKRILNTFAQYGLNEDRLLILEPVPNREDVKEHLKLSDIYLDSYPYSGMTSLVDPLEVGLPTVVMETETSRSRKGASLLRELGRYDLITNNEEDYIKLAIALGTNPELRQQKSAEIKDKMQGNPSFLDSRSYSDKIGSLFQEIFNNYLIDSLSPNLCLGNTNLIIFPDWSQPEDLLYQELASVISTLATHPNKNHTTLLIDIHNISEEEANLLLSSLTMSLIMEEDIDITEGPQISLLGQITEKQWKIILPKIDARIILAIENKEIIAHLKAEHLTAYKIDSFS